jgi:hypothetical protein
MQGMVAQRVDSNQAQQTTALEPGCEPKHQPSSAPPVVKIDTS